MAVHVLANRSRRTCLLGAMGLGVVILTLLPAHGRPSVRNIQDEEAASMEQQPLAQPPAQAKQPAEAQQPAQQSERHKMIVQALQKGVEHLRATQTPQGTWAIGKQPHQVGYAAMPALAMLEVGVPANDAGVQKAAQFVRSMSPRMEDTYEIALTILFLNRLGDPIDVPLIRRLALRLVAGQCPTGGWSYRCPILVPADEKMLMTYLKENQPKFANTNSLVMHPFLRQLPRSLEGLVDPIVKKERETQLDPISDPPINSQITLPDIVPKGSSADPDESMADPVPSTPLKKKGDDAKPSGDRPRQDLPRQDPAPTLPAEPKATGGKDTKKPGGTGKDAGKDGPKKDTRPFGERLMGDKKEVQKPALAPLQATAVPIQQWPSVPPYVKEMMIGSRANGWAMGQQIEDNSNTQFAILGLWAARKHGVPVALTLVKLDQRFRLSQLNDGSWAYHLPGFAGDPKKAKHQMPTPSMTCVGLMGLGVAHGAFQEAALAQKKNPVSAQLLYDPAIQRGLLALSRGVDPRINFQGAKVNLYFFWSLERVMVMYHLPTVGGVDWHTWGTDVLLPRQTQRGSWVEGGYPGSSEPIDTSMALLFLSRANLNRDLSESLRRYVVVIDPARINR